MLSDIQYLRMAYDCAWEHSTDPDTKNGAVLAAHDGQVILGCNHIPTPLKVTRERRTRPAKYAWTEHAERNVIFHAANRGIQTRGATLYCPWFACADCARAILQAGVVRVVGHRLMLDRTPEPWRESIALGDEMLDEAGVIREYVTDTIGGTYARMNGETWRP